MFYCGCNVKSLSLSAFLSVCVFDCLNVPAQQKHSTLCVINKLDKLCDGNASVNAFSCYYTANLQEISVTGWSLKLNNNQMSPDKKQLALRNQCTLKTEEPKSCDAFMSYFNKGGIQVQSRCAKFSGLSRWWLHVLASPVSILVERLIQKHDVMVTSWNVTSGQRIRLTCVLICTSNSGTNPGLIWYKDSLPLQVGRVGSSPILLLDPISHKHQGSYVCASVGHQFSRSSAVKLTVQAEIRPIYLDKELPSPRSVVEKDPSRSWSPLSLFCIILVVALCCGLGGVAAVGIVAWQERRKIEGLQRRNQREEDRCAGSVFSGPSSHIYSSLEASSQSTNQYERVGNVLRFSDASYENQG